MNSSSRSRSRSPESRVKSNFSNSKPYVILIGAVGSGKTTLSEKLTGKRNLGVKAFGSSATRVSTIYHTESFEFADTPGYMCFDNKLDHAVNIVCAMHYRSVSRIFILVKFDSRIDNMYRGIKDIVAPLLNYRNLLTILVTAWDLSDRSEQTKIEIRNRFSQMLNIQSTDFVEKETSGEELKRVVRTTFTNAIKIEIPHEKIHKYFDIKKEELEMITYISEKTNEYRKLVQDARASAEANVNPSEKENFAFFAQVALKDIIEDFKKDFLAKFELDPLKPEEFAALNQFHNELTATLRGYRAYCKQFNTYGNGSDNPISPFRKCPRCGEVYIKVQFYNCEG